MGKYKPYPKYKDSGVEWLPDIPTGWNVCRNKEVLRKKQMTVGTQSDSYTLLSLTLTGVIPRDLESGKGKMPESFETYQAVMPNDLIFCLFDMDETPRTIGISAQKGMVTGAYTVVNCRRQAAPRFIYYYYLHIDSFKGLRPFYTGLRKVVRPETFMNVALPIPSPEEQAQIAAFLDHETAKIDHLIEKQEKLIELLKEKRQAVISHAVTKGLDPNAPMKDSGVEWLGEIPAHWEVKRLKHVAVLQSGLAKGRTLRNVETLQVPYLRVANVQDGYVKLDDVAEMEIEPHELSRYLLQAGDVLMNEGGDNDKLGRGTVWNAEIHPCIHQNHVFAIRSRQIEPEWLSLLTQSSYAKFHFYCKAKQSTNLASISATNIMETPLVVPPAEDRKAISQHIARLTLKIDNLDGVSRRKIQLLQERRTALISAAVTGKIDLREWQPEQAS